MDLGSVQKQTIGGVGLNECFSRFGNLFVTGKQKITFVNTLKKILCNLCRTPGSFKVLTPSDLFSKSKQKPVEFLLAFFIVVLFLKKKRSIA